MAGPPLTSDYEQRQQAALVRARRRATGLLLVVAIGFVAASWLPEATWAGYLAAALEAGLVGGLADWFAVVALFRHPLGIPIPHTAVIPRSKEGLGTNLAAFVRDNFLQPDQLGERLGDPVNVDRVATWLADPVNAQRVAAQLAALAASALDGLDEDRLVDRVVQSVRRRVGSVPVSTLAGQELEAAIRGGRHVELVDATIEGLRTALIRNRAPLRRRLGMQSPAWVPEFVDDVVFDRAEEVVRTFLAQVADDRAHEIRVLLDEQLLGMTDRMQHDEGVRERIAAAVEDVLDDERLGGWVRAWWADVRTRVDAAADPDRDGGTLRRLAVEAIVDFAGRLRTDEQLRRRVTVALEGAAPRLAEVGQREVGGIIAGTIDRWDAEETSRRLEAWMGPDLQFVRINGTLVGALVGLVLHGVRQLLG